MKAIKIVLDVIMTILFILLMKVSFVGIVLHELIGIGIFFLFIVHQLLNYKWIINVCKGISSGKTNGRVNFMLGVDLVVLLFVTFNVISGILISQTILTGIEVSNIERWSTLHHFAAYSSLVLLSVHIGLHWQMLMNVFKKLLGLTEKNPIRTLLARITLAVVVFMGIKSITNPEVYGNFVAPFTPVATPIIEPVTLWTYNSKKESEQSISTMQVAMLSTNELVVDVPSLEEFLSKLVCTGCGKRCPLTLLRCGKGTQYKNSAVVEYQETYAQDNAEVPDETMPSESGTLSDSDVSESEHTQDSTTNELDNALTGDDEKPLEESVPNTELPNGTFLESDSGVTSPLDYIGLMGIVIAGTHYTIAIPKRLRTGKGDNTQNTTGDKSIN